MASRSERDRVRTVAELLRELGYPLVETDVAVAPERSPLRADVVAWAAYDGLRPEVLVEVKSGKVTERPETLEHLSHLSMLAGAAQSYVFDGTTWLKANKTFTELEPHVGPDRHPVVEEPVILPRRVSDDLAARAVWAAANEMRGEGSDAAALVERAMRHLEAQASAVPMTLASGWSVINALTAVLGRRTEFGLREDVGRAMAGMLAMEDGDVVLDPFCGIGGCLWAALEEADADGLTISAFGVDVNESVVDVAKRLADGFDVDVTVQQGDSLRSDLVQANRVITVPPWGLKISEPVPLQMGGVTKDGDVATLDRSLAALKPGGRLVAHVSRGFLHRQRGNGFRNWVSENYAVAGVIGLPAGLAIGTQIPSAFLIIDHAPATESTLVADLHDWRNQLKQGTAIMATLKSRKR